MAAQRIRTWFRKGERVRYISHLDVLRYWERAIRRAGLPLSYSEGFTPHPKLAFAGPLPLGFLAESEVMDVTLDERIAVDDFRSRLAVESTPDLSLVDAREVALASAPPQATVAWADYSVEIPGVSGDEVSAAVGAFLAAASIPWVEERHEKSREYDLRAAVAMLTAEPWAEGVRLTMRLQSDQQLTARPEQVVAAVVPGIATGNITRTGLVLDEPSPAHDLWRRKGRFER